MAKGTKKSEKMVCGKCSKEMAVTNFYNSSSPLFPDGKANVCKNCIKKIVDYENIETVYSVLQAIDIPFLYDIWEKCEVKKEEEEEKGKKYDTLGNYIRQVNSLPNYNGLRWKDSLFEKSVFDKDNSKGEVYYKNKGFTNITDMSIDDLCEKWGYGYTEEELSLFEKKYRKLVDSYGEKTSVHVENLITYIRFRVKEELATAKGDAVTASKWASMADNAAKSGKITVQQLSKSDISGGIDLMPQLFEAVEDKVGIIPTLPQLKEQPYDDADLIIWAIINYTQRLEDKPRIEYREIWNFYDEMLIDFYKQKGFTDEQIKKERDKRNAVFRDLGKVYVEPLYDEGDVI